MARVDRSSDERDLSNCVGDDGTYGDLWVEVDDVMALFADWSFWFSVPWFFRDKWSATLRTKSVDRTKLEVDSASIQLTLLAPILRNYQMVPFLEN